jgi:hypothetical protein
MGHRLAGGDGQQADQEPPDPVTVTQEKERGEQDQEPRRQ